MIAQYNTLVTTYYYATRKACLNFPEKMNANSLL